MVYYNSIKRRNVHGQMKEEKVPLSYMSTSNKFNYIPQLMILNVEGYSSFIVDNPMAIGSCSVDFAVSGPVPACTDSDDGAYKSKEGFELIDHKQKFVTPMEESEGERLKKIKLNVGYQ